MTYRRSTSSSAKAASVEDVFALLDDPKSFGRHMEQRSVMMLGSSMSYKLDGAEGRAIGSVIEMNGAILGITLHVEEVVIERLPPHSKAWATRGLVQLIVIGPYKMGFRIQPKAVGCRLSVTIDYNLPHGSVGRVLGRLFGDIYARWCVRQITGDDRLH